MRKEQRPQVQKPEPIRDSLNRKAVIPDMNYAGATAFMKGDLYAKRVKGRMCKTYRGTYR
jgi:hypothetical protein